MDEILRAGEDVARAMEKHLNILDTYQGSDTGYACVMVRGTEETREAIRLLEDKGIDHEQLMGNVIYVSREGMDVLEEAGYRTKNIRGYIKGLGLRNRMASALLLVDASCELQSREFRKAWEGIPIAHLTGMVEGDVPEEYLGLSLVDLNPETV